MVSSVYFERLSRLESPSTSQQDKSIGYHQILNEIATTSDPSQLTRNLAYLIDSILGKDLGIVAARPLLGAYIEVLKLKSRDVQIESGRHTLQAIESRVVSFEEQDALIREILADAYQMEEDFIEAAKILQGVQLNSSQRKIDDDTKVKTWIRICRLYLEVDDTTSAESYLNRAKNLLYKVEDKELNLMFHLSQARILDSRRKFLDASRAYHDISLSLVLAEEERNISLSKAIVCAVLAPAGPQRSRVLRKLFKDERAVQFEEFGILENMFLDRLISSTEVERFASKLDPHQLAQTADGSTVLAKAVIEHNLLGVSRLYSNIGIIELGVLLNLDANKAEEYAARMLQQGRLSGRIDQIDNVIYFDSKERNGDRITDSHAGYLDVRGLRRWDTNVQGLAEDVERVSSLLQSKLPVG